MDLLLPSESLRPVGERGLGDAMGIVVVDGFPCIAASRASLWFLTNSSMVRLSSGGMRPYPKLAGGGTTGG